MISCSVSPMRAGAFTGVRVPARPRVAIRSNSRMIAKASDDPAFPSDWIKADPIVLSAGLLGWSVPSSIPVPALGGQSLFGCLFSSIVEELSHFPTGPALTDRFWLYLITWHIGLFLTITLGQIGAQGRKQGYW